MNNFYYSKDNINNEGAAMFGNNEWASRVKISENKRKIVDNYTTCLAFVTTLICFTVYKFKELTIKKEIELKKNILANKKQ